MFVGRCVCVSVFVQWGFPFEVLHIWAGYLERLLCGANARRQREGEDERRQEEEETCCCFIILY